MKFLLPFTLAALLAAAPAAIAEQADATPQIAVSGEGEQAVKPDMALVTLTVLREADTARGALDANNEAMARVIAAMKEEGVAPKDLQTSGLSINPRYVYPDDGDGRKRPRIVAYRVTNTLSMRVGDLDRLGAIIDRSVSLGVNQGGNITFTNEDASAALAAARKQAVENAVAKAHTLAEAAGVRVGRILEIREGSATPPPAPLGVKAMRMEAAADAVPVEAGENTYHVQVEMRFAVEQ